MWTRILCLALLTSPAFSKSVTLDELKRAMSDYLAERADDDLGDLNGLFGDKRDGEAPIGGGASGGEAPIGGGPAGGEVEAPIGGGPAGAEEMDIADLFNTGSKPSLEQRDSMGMSDRLVASVEQAKAAVDAGHIQMRSFSEPQKRSDYKYTMCVFCDAMCIKQITAAGYTTDTYFGAITKDMNAFLDGIDAGGMFTLSYKLMPGSDTYLDWFGDSTLTGEQLMVAINNNFWKKSGLYKLATSYGCDVDFLISSGSDPAWSKLSPVSGVANMMQLCQASYSTVKMSDDPSATASLVMHEFGHMVGLYHDGPLDKAYTSMAKYFEDGGILAACSSQYDALTANCVEGVSGIMSAVVGGTAYSPCSSAYFKMFTCLVNVMPSWYSTSCVD